jgi:hypothetical protein
VDLTGKHLGTGSMNDKRNKPDTCIGLRYGNLLFLLPLFVSLFIDTLSRTAAEGAARSR